MDIRDRSGLRLQARYVLEGSGKTLPRLSLLSSAVLVLVPLAANALSLLLEGPISQTGGLSGMGTRNILETIRQLLILVPSLLLPFWGAGFLYGLLGTYRGERMEPKSLLEGLRRFGALLRMYLLLLAGIYFLSMAAATLTAPLCAGVGRLLMPVVTAETQELAEEAMAQIGYLELALAAWPMLLAIAAGLFYFGYRLRFAQYLLMDDAYPRAMAALLGSFRMTRRNVSNLLKLDLSFWWYYLLEGLLALVCYGDLLWTVPGLSETGSYFLFYGLYALGTMALHYALRPQVSLTYAAAYEALRKE